MINKLTLKFNKLTSYIVERDLLLSIIIALLLIFLTFSIGAYNNKAVPVSSGVLSHYNLEPNNPLKILSNWDGPNYIRIANNGYESNYLTNFFPLYPLLVRLVHQIVSSPLVSALFVSWICFILAIYFYLKIVKKLFNLKSNKRALYGLVFFILFPTSVFLMATYNTSLLAFLSLGAIYYALQKRPLISGIFGFFATLTHITGVFVVILCALILLENKINIGKVITTFVIGMLGIGSYSYYLANHFNNAFAFVSSQKVHGWLTFHISTFFKSFELINAVMVVLVVFSIAYWWNKKKSFSIYSFLFLLIPLIGGQFGGFNRYCLLDFPIALMGYSFLRDKRAWYTLIIIIASIGWAYYAFQYLGGYVGG